MKATRGISLHIGLNQVDQGHYGGWSGPLQACEADAEEMQRIAGAQGFASTLLLTAEATREAVIDGIRAATAELKEGDIFFLSYSGHGGQVPDVNGDETDLEDETWCLYDGQLIDDELYALWGQVAAGVRVLVLSDSCHSGTVVKMAFYGVGEGEVPYPLGRNAPRDGDVRYRVMPRDVALRTYRRNRAFYRQIGRAAAATPPPIAATVRLISGCQDNQLSMDGTFNGLFTGTLLQVWNDGGFSGDYGAFHAAIVSRMPPTQSPNHYVIGVANPAYDGEQPFTV